MPIYKAIYEVRKIAYADIDAKNDYEACEKARNMEIVPGSWETNEDICATDILDEKYQWNVNDVQSEDGESIMG